MSIRTVIVRTIEEIPARDWLVVFPQVLENYYFLKTLDESKFDEFSFSYIMVYDGDTPVGATSCFLMRFPLHITVKGFLRKLYDGIEKLFPNLLTPRVLMCGLPMGQGRIGVRGEPARVIGAIRVSLEQIAAREKASLIVFKDFIAAYDSLLAPLAKQGFSKIESIPSTGMKIPWKSFDEYMKSLSRVSRDGLKRKYKRVDAAVKIECQVVEALDEPTLGDVYGLYMQTFMKLDMGLEKLTPEFFRRISGNMPHQTKYFLWKIEGKLVAFALCLVSGDYFIDYYLGFDYRVAHEYNLYFIRFRDLLGWCIKNGISYYEMGVTTYEPKRRLGFDFIRLYFYMKHRNRFINLFFGFFSHFFKPENFDSVFDEMEEREPA